MADPILDLLNNAELRALVAKILGDVCSFAKTIHDNPPEDMKNLKAGDLWEEAWRRAQASKDSDVAVAFVKKLFVKRPEPFRVTLAETVDAFWAVAKPLQCSLANEPIRYAEGVYTAFLNLVANKVLEPGDLPSVTIARVHDGGEYSLAECPEGIIGRQLVPLQDDPNDPDGIMWMDKSLVASGSANDAKREAEDRLWRENLWDADGMGVSILVPDELAGESRNPCVDFLDDFPEGLEFLEARVAGRISQQAGSKLTSELARVLPSVIRSMAVVQERPNPASEGTFVTRCERRLPVITLAVLVENIQFVRRCLDAYFSRPSKNGSMEQRIRNAVTLLVESDTQLNDAVGLALSVAAIEALLGEQGSDVTERLKRNLATLLEPDRDVRAKAEAFFKKLYDQRSAALHGRELDNMSEHRHNGRLVAAGVLYSIVSRQDFRRRLGDEPDTPKELLRHLGERHYSAGQPDAIPELPLTRLWRESEPRRPTQ